MTKPRGGLGRGLEALIPTRSTPLTGLQELDVDAIVPNPRQPRQRLEEEALQELATSIKEHGVLQPLVVTALPSPPGQPPRYQIIAGERRWQAARRAGLKTVPAVIKDVTPQETLELALVENLQRADLNPLEEAMAYRQLVDEFGLTQEQIATRVGKNRVTVANSLRLLNLSDPVKAALAEGTISEGHARALLGLDSPEQQVAAMHAILAKGLSVRATEELVRRLQEITSVTGGSPEEETGVRGKDPQTAELEDAFRRALGTKVELYRSSRGGRLVIHFYSDEELDGIYNAIVRQ